MRVRVSDELCRNLEAIVNTVAFILSKMDVQCKILS